MSGVRVNLCKTNSAPFPRIFLDKCQPLTTFVYISVSSLGRDAWLPFKSAGFSFTSAVPMVCRFVHSGSVPVCRFRPYRPAPRTKIDTHSCTPSAIELRFSWQVGWPIRSLRRKRETGTMPGSRRCASTSWCMYFLEDSFFRGGRLANGNAPCIFRLFRK